MVIETVAFEIARFDLLSGLAVEITNALVVYLFVPILYLYLDHGFPLSTSIIGNGAIIGTAFARGRGTIDNTVIGRLVATWALPLPATAMVNRVLYVSLSQFIKL